MRASVVSLSAEVWLEHPSSVAAAFEVVALAKLAAAVALSVSPQLDPNPVIAVCAVASVVVVVLASVS